MGPIGFPEMDTSLPLITMNDNLMKESIVITDLSKSEHWASEVRVWRTEALEGIGTGNGDHSVNRSGGKGVGMLSNRHR